MNILITGGTGLLGQRLIDFLKKKDFRPRLLSRSPKDVKHVPAYKWSIADYTIDPDAFSDVDAIIHLAGANVGEARWSPKRKKQILDSRIRSTRLLYEHVEKLENKPKTLICASATGYYGIHDYKHESTESDPSGEDFLAEVCRQWEAEADKFTMLDMRVIKARTGVVLDANGGALPKMTQPIKYLFGAALGSGQQFLSWIHWEDWCASIYQLLIQDQHSGAFNLVAPNPVTNAKLTRLIARTIKRPIWLPNVPRIVLKMMLGEMSSIVLEGHQIIPQHLKQIEFIFKYETAESAIFELLGQD